MIWKGSWLHTQRIKVRRLPILPFPHTPQTGDRIPIGRPSRKLWWKSEQTTSSWLVRRLPSTFTPTTPSEKKPMPFFIFLHLFYLVVFDIFWLIMLVWIVTLFFLSFFKISFQDGTHLLIRVLAAQPFGWHWQALPQLDGSRPRRWPSVCLWEAIHHTSGVLAMAQGCLWLHDCLLD